MKTPALYKAKELTRWSEDREAIINDKKVWIPARAYYFSGLNIMQRLMYSWGVFIGKYDAIDWQEEL